MIVFVFSSQYPVLFIFYQWSDCVVCFFFQRQYPVPFMFLPAKWFGFFWCVFSRVSSQSLSFFYPWNDGGVGGGSSQYPVPFIFYRWSDFFSLSPGSEPSPSHFVYLWSDCFSRVATQSLSFFTCEVGFFFSLQSQCPVHWTATTRTLLLTTMAPVDNWTKTCWTTTTTTLMVRCLYSNS